MKKKIILLLRLFLSFLILFLLVYKIGFTSILQNILSANIFLIFVVLFIWLILFMLGTYNFIILLKPFNIRIHFLKLFKYYMLAWSSGLFFPGKAGELVLLHFFKKERIEIGKGLAVYLLDKLITLFILLILSILGFMIFSSFKQALGSLIILLLVLAIFLFFILTKIGREFITKYILGKYSTLFSGFSKTLFYFLRSYKSALLKNIMITILKSFIGALATFILFLSFGISINFFYILIIDSIITIISFIPITPNGLGVKESSAVLLYSLLNIDSIAIVTSTYILATILVYFIGFITFISIKVEEL